MELKAIVGREPANIKGIQAFLNIIKKPITEKTAKRVHRFLHQYCILKEYYLTDENEIGFNQDSKPLKVEEGKNLFFYATKIIDPTKIYSYLTDQGFILKHTKLRN